MHFKRSSRDNAPMVKVFRHIVHLALRQHRFELCMWIFFNKHLSRFWSTVGSADEEGQLYALLWAILSRGLGHPQGVLELIPYRYWGTGKVSTARGSTPLTPPCARVTTMYVFISVHTLKPGLFRLEITERPGGQEAKVEPMSLAEPRRGFCVSWRKLKHDCVLELLSRTDCDWESHGCMKRADDAGTQGFTALSCPDMRTSRAEAAYHSFRKCMDFQDRSPLIKWRNTVYHESLVDF